MLYPPVADMLKHVESRYLLVNVVAQRARQISEEAEVLNEELTDKPVTLAIREVAEGQLIRCFYPEKEVRCSAEHKEITVNK